MGRFFAPADRFSPQVRCNSISGRLVAATSGTALFFLSLRPCCNILQFHVNGGNSKNENVALHANAHRDSFVFPSRPCAFVYSNRRMACTQDASCPHAR